ncbi:hypothetical protein C0993_001584 [Termitomyces sp. T159_Od127]|nr:hypothetical protein C0993_001584 [Termitomyces sp. T159_Od127]
MAAYSAQLLGASAVYVVDKVPERLTKAQEIGCTAIDLSKGDAAEQILSLRGGREVDRGVDGAHPSSLVPSRKENDTDLPAVGFQAHTTTPNGDMEQPSIVLEGLVKVVRATGGLGVPGLYVPSDPKAPDSESARGYVPFPMGKFFEKGLTMGAGQCNVKAYDRHLRDLIIAGKAKPSFVVSHDVSLDDAQEAYDKFDRRVEGYTKVLLHP